MKKKLGQNPIILAVDTSCDDTSAAVLCGRTILSNVISSQTELHKPYGGVFPTIAKQAHKENIEPTVRLALKRASAVLKEIKKNSSKNNLVDKNNLSGNNELADKNNLNENNEPVINNSKFVANSKLLMNNIDALAITVGPGLAPALEVGINYMRNLSLKTGKPLIAVNHIEGHVLSVLAERNKRKNVIEKKDRETEKINLENSLNKKGVEKIKKYKLTNNKINYPVLSIVVSGGHTQFILFSKIGKYEIIGESIDDAAGECIDKIGRMLNLGYPAGPIVEKFARLGNPKAIAFPLPMTTTKNFNMSFSGLKTFARNYIENNYGKTSLNKQQIYDFCASAQFGVFRHIIYKLNKVLEKYSVAEVWLGGGVSANIKLRQMIRESLKKFEKRNSNEVAQKHNNEIMRISATTRKIIFRTPFTNKLCMDNAAMIGVVAGYKFKRGEFITNLNELDRRPRWEIK